MTSWAFRPIIACNSVFTFLSLSRNNGQACLLRSDGKSVGKGRNLMRQRKLKIAKTKKHKSEKAFLAWAFFYFGLFSIFSAIPSEAQAVNNSGAFVATLGALNGANSNF